MHERSHLSRAVQAWLLTPARRAVGTPDCYVLDNTTIAQLVQAAHSRVRTLEGLVQVLSETKEWRSLYGHSLLDVLQGFDLEAKVMGNEWKAEYKAEMARKKEAEKAKKSKDKQGVELVADAGSVPGGEVAVDVEMGEEESCPEEQEIEGSEENRRASTEACPSRSWVHAFVMTVLQQHDTLHELLLAMKLVRKI